jgi:hypothetical protein
MEKKTARIGLRWPYVFIHANLLFSIVAAMGGAYEFCKNASANLREKDDALNQAFGGFVAGSMLGLSCTSPSYKLSFHIY